jgi:hypothetical protein
MGTHVPTLFCSASTGTNYPEKLKAAQSKTQRTPSKAQRTQSQDVDEALCLTS